MWVKWKQFVSDEHWSTPRLVMDYDRIAVFAAAKPPLLEHKFSEEAKAKHLNFLDKLEAFPPNLILCSINILTPYPWLAIVI